jgi:hypothetical protein
MSVLGCPRIDDAATYVLRAMTDGEWEDYELHLHACADCSEKVAELEFASDALLSGVPQLSAPPAIRDRVMAVVRAEAELMRAAGASADRPVVTRPPRRFRLTLRPLSGAALASVLLALGIGGGMLLRGDGGTPTRTLSAESSSAGKAQLRVADGAAKLVVAGLPAPPPGRVYQVWLENFNDRQPPAPTDSLFSVSKKGRTTVYVPGDLDDVSAVLVTDEPIGGSEIPTGKKVIDIRLS